MYDKLLTLLSACESLVQRFEDLRYVGMQDQVDKPSVLPKTYGAYHDAFRTWQLYSAETRQCMEELNAMPAFRASLRPMAIACFRLVTFLPEPERRVPSLRSCSTVATFFWAAFPYFAITTSLLA